MTIENIQKGLRINEQFTLGLYVIIRAYHITSTLTQKLQKYCLKRNLIQFVPQTDEQLYANIVRK